MKILYAVQATGNGHISRAHQVYPVLQQFGDVDIFLSGSNATLPTDFPVKFRSQGLSLFYKPCGDLDYWKTMTSIRLSRIRKEAADLPVEKYDVVLNDFEHITARACALKKVPSIQFGHQASFMSEHTPRPVTRSWMAEWLLKNYAPASKYAGLHFEPYDHFIFSPIIKQEFIQAKPEDHGHLTVYLPAYDVECLDKIFSEIAPMPVHWFVHHVDKPTVKGNITYFPVGQANFNHSLIHCHALLTGGGFETPAEALYLGKKLMMIPIKGQYEQICNAEALKRKGIQTMKSLNESNKHVFFEWLKLPKPAYSIQANDVKKTLETILK